VSPAPGIVVVGLGPAGPEFLSPAVIDALRQADHAFVRTEQHPAVSALRELLGPALRSFDQCYKTEASFDAVYARIVEELVALGTSSAVAYAVPGSPLIGERTVELLRADGRVPVTIIPGMSFLDLAWERLGVDPLAAGVRLVDAMGFATGAAGDPGPLLVAQCHSKAVLSEVKLALEDFVAAPGTGPRRPVLLHHLGLPDEQVREVAWEDLDRTLDADHLTALWVPRLAEPAAAALVRLEDLMRTLRAHCPWDRRQTHATLAPHLLEETYEALEAIEEVSRHPGEDVPAAAITHLEEELGDVLFQVVFHSALAGEAGWFTLADVASRVHDKLVYRHPHVFADTVADTPEAVAANWEVLKKAEKGREAGRDGIPGALPALALVAKLRRKATSAGLEVHDPGAAGEELRVEIEKLLSSERTASDRPSNDAPTHEQLLAAGNLLFLLAGLVQDLGIDPETALLAGAGRFRQLLTTTE
jgi:tetrapyrrole methylase family protein/MazG family protein